MNCWCLPLLIAWFFVHFWSINFRNQNHLQGLWHQSNSGTIEVQDFHWPPLSGSRIGVWTFGHYSGHFILPYPCKFWHVTVHLQKTTSHALSIDFWLHHWSQGLEIYFSSLTHLHVHGISQGNWEALHSWHQTWNPRVQLLPGKSWQWSELL